MDVAVLAALNPKHLAARGPRILWQSAIKEGEVVEDDNEAEVLVDDVPFRNLDQRFRPPTRAGGFVQFANKVLIALP